ncbi:hypothetical protein Tco_0540889 [Tanacetum coccineum]
MMSFGKGQYQRSCLRVLTTSKGYVDQLKRLGYMLPQDLVFGLILNGLTKDFAGFVRNYNMHNMGKMIGELHAMLIDTTAKDERQSTTAQEVVKGKRIVLCNLAELLNNKKSNCVHASSSGKMTRKNPFIHRLEGRPDHAWTLLID